VVYAKKPFAGPQAVLAYLSRYTHRVAISNRRLISADQTGVTFTWKDYRIDGPGRYETMTLATHEFIRRFLMHVLPKGLHRLPTQTSSRAPDSSGRHRHVMMPSMRSTNPVTLTIPAGSSSRRAPDYPRWINHPAVAPPIRLGKARFVRSARHPHPSCETKRCRSGLSKDFQRISSVAGEFARV
jgi:hypothetical protein